MILSRQDGTTSLIAAAQSGSAATVQLLLDYKADPSVANQVQRLREPPIPSLLVDLFRVSNKRDLFPGRNLARESLLSPSTHTLCIHIIGDDGKRGKDMN
jgi:ankyrin repeat protein